MLDMTAYYTANESSLGVKSRRFHQWFREYEDDLQNIVKKAEPKPKKPRHQNKVVCQAERTRWAATQKMDFIREWGRMRAENPSLTQKEFCEIRQKKSVPRKRKRKQPPGPPPGSPPKRRRKLDIEPSTIASKQF